MTVDAPGDERATGRVAGSGGTVHLQPGQYAAGDGLHTLTTMVGSCIAVCLHDIVRRTGGMNHFVMPEAPPGLESARYGDVATRALVALIESQGSQRRHLQARIIGGASLLPGLPDSESGLGRANAAAAATVLADFGIPVVQFDVGGERGRHVTFRATSGDVAARLL